MNREQEQKAEAHIRKNNTCLFACVDWVCGRDINTYLNGFASSFPFCYRTDLCADVGTRIVSAENALFNILMRRYSGYNVCFEKHDSYSGIKKLQRACDNGSKIILGMDAFYCGWSSAYQKMHILHSIVVTGYDKGSGEISGIDPFDGKERRVVLPAEAYHLGYENIRVLTPCKDYEKLTEKKAVEILLRNYDERRCEDAFASFCANIGAAVDMAALFDSRDVRNCALIRKCRGAATGRYGIALLLHRCAVIESRGQYGELEDLFYESAGVWQCLAMLCMKLCLTGKSFEETKGKLQAYIEGLGRLERKCGELLEDMNKMYRIKGE